MAQRMTTIWIDVQGHSRFTQLTTSAGAAAVASALAAKSSAAVQAYWEGALTVTAAPAPSGSTYPSTHDLAELLYQTAGGDIVKVMLPAPVSSIFLADQETVDPAQVAAITAAVLANVIAPDGSSPTVFVGGTRRRA